jgi:hypothetical protein
MIEEGRTRRRSAVQRSYPPPSWTWHILTHSLWMRFCGSSAAPCSKASLADSYSSRLYSARLHSRRYEGH